MRIALVALLCATGIHAQPPKFDAASIRVVEWTPGERPRDRVETSATTVTMRDVTLSFAIQWAYDTPFYRIDGPDWLKDRRYDILATTEDPASGSVLREMTRALLAERFNLIVRRELQPRAVYRLINAKETVKLRPSPPGKPGSLVVTNGSFVFTNTTMREFAEQLSDFATMDRPVVDQTGTEGAFDFTLESAASAIRGGPGPSIFTAVSELGLRLEPVREPLEVLIVEGASRIPSEN